MLVINKKPKINVAIIGGGYSALTLLFKLSKSKSKKLNFTIFDPSSQFGRGLPYGEKSHLSFLMNSPVCRLSFGDSSSSLESWITKYHASKFKNTDIKKAYISRRFFGQYIEWKYGLESLEYEYKNFYIDKITPKNRGYTLYFDNQTKDFDLVILAIGSQSTPSFLNSLNDNYIQNIYSKVGILEKKLASKKANIAILGTSSAFLDVMRLLQSMNLSEYPNITSISGSGIIPSKGVVNYNCNYKLKFLNNELKINQVVNSLKKELSYAFEKNISILDLRAEINLWLKNYLSLQTINNKIWFLKNSANSFESLMKRGAPEVINFAESLIKDNKLKIIADRIIEIEELDDLSFKINCNKKTINADIILNCLGSASINKSKSTLIKSLINDCNCTPSFSKAGLLVNDNFMLAKNLFAFGPIITGSVNKYGAFHHLENVKKIYDLSFQFEREFFSFLDTYKFYIFSL